MRFEFETELVNPIASHNQSRYNRHGQVYKSKQEYAYIHELEYRLMAYIKQIGNFEKYGEVPIRADYIFGFAPTKSWSKKKIQRALNQEIYPTEQNKGDWDNLTKSTQDRLNKLIIADDRFIVDGRARKIFTPKPYLRIEIEEV